MYKQTFAARVKISAVVAGALIALMPAGQAWGTPDSGGNSCGIATVEPVQLCVGGQHHHRPSRFALNLFERTRS